MNETDPPKQQERPTRNDATAAEIRALMAAKRKTTSDLAAILGVSRSTASRRLSGNITLDFQEVETIAHWLEVPYERLVTPPAPLAYAS